MAAENSEPWYSKERYQVILLIAALLGLAVGILSLITAEGIWRIVSCDCLQHHLHGPCRVTDSPTNV